MVEDKDQNRSMILVYKDDYEKLVDKSNKLESGINKLTRELEDAKHIILHGKNIKNMIKIVYEASLKFIDRTGYGSEETEIEVQPAYVTVTAGYGNEVGIVGDLRKDIFDAINFMNDELRKHVDEEMQRVHVENVAAYVNKIHSLEKENERLQDAIREHNKKHWLNRNKINI